MPEPAPVRKKMEPRHILLVIALLIMLIANAFLASEKNRLARDVEEKGLKIQELEQRLETHSPD